MAAGKEACKPDSVPTRKGWVVTIYLGLPLPTGSSDQPGDWPALAGWPGAITSPYSVLLRMGFTLPPMSPPERCALTAPFHP